MRSGCSVADAMTTKPVTIPSTTTVRDASKIMRDHGIGSLLVVDDGALLGIIIADDIVHRVTAESRKSDTTTIRDVMTADLVTITPDKDVHDAMRLMHEHDILHLPVIDEQKRLVGYLTLKDILSIEPQLFEIMAEFAEVRGGRGAFGGHALREGYCEECGNYASRLHTKNGHSVCSYCAELTAGTQQYL